MKTKTSWLKSVALLFVLISTAIWVISCKSPHSTSADQLKNPATDSQAWAIVIHGGAGPMTKANLDTSLERQYKEALTYRASYR